jgi:hypothetical protein
LEPITGIFGLMTPDRAGGTEPPVRWIGLFASPGGLMIVGLLAGALALVAIAVVIWRGGSICRRR